MTTTLSLRATRALPPAAAYLRLVRRRYAHLITTALMPCLPTLLASSSNQFSSLFSRFSYTSSVASLSRFSHSAEFTATTSTEAQLLGVRIAAFTGGLDSTAVRDAPSSSARPSRRLSGCFLLLGSLCGSISRMAATPNHALQRTAPCVTAPASTAAFPPTMQVPRRTPLSLSLGSLGDSKRSSPNKATTMSSKKKTPPVICSDCNNELHDYKDIAAKSGCKLQNRSRPQQTTL